MAVDWQALSERTKLPHQIFAGITSDEWIELGCEPEFVSCLTDDAKLTLLEDAASHRVEIDQDCAGVLDLDTKKLFEFEDRHGYYPGPYYVAAPVPEGKDPDVYGDLPALVKDADGRLCAQRVPWSYVHKYKARHKKFPDDVFTLGDALPEPVQFKETLTAEQREYGVELLKAPVGPVFDESIFYGPAGKVIRKIMPFSEAHPVGMYMNLIISLGSIFGRGAYFSVGKTKHYTNEFLVCAGTSSLSRKGTGRNEIDELLKAVDSSWHPTGGFGSPQGVISKIKDSSSYQKRVTKKGITTFETVVVPGVDDKRLCIREGEISALFKLASAHDTNAAETLRNSWDSTELRNNVAGKDNDGASNSLACREPHVSISGDTTINELKATIPPGSDKNGFGNRFLYCYIYRTKLVPNNGPEVDFKEDIAYFQKIAAKARGQKHIDLSAPAGEAERKSMFMPFTPEANQSWKRWYSRNERGVDRLTGIAGNMTDRGPAHVRRLAMILALIDGDEAIDLCHLEAALKLWEYCKESARFIFSGHTREQERILDNVQAVSEGMTLREIRERVFGKHRSAEWVKAQTDSLIASGYLVVAGDKVVFKSR
jgi:hypothetical protein